MSVESTDWPENLATYKRTPEFDAASCPKALQRAHSTKPGVWAKLHVLAGELLFRDIETGRESLLRSGIHPLIFPQRLHEVEPREGVRFFVEFHAHDPEGK